MWPLGSDREQPLAGYILVGRTSIRGGRWPIRNLVCPEGSELLTVGKSKVQLAIDRAKLPDAMIRFSASKGKRKKPDLK
jgi:hypothetical protein